MTAVQPHPTWCDLEQCRAYGHPELEPYHRSAPTTIPLARGEVLAVFLTQPAGLPEMTAVELVALEPTSAPAWAAEHVFAVLSVPLDPAAALAQALRQMIRTATA